MAFEQTLPEHLRSTKEANLGLRQKLGKIASEWFKGPASIHREYVDPRVPQLLERPIADEARLVLLQEDAKANKIDLANLGLGEGLALTLARHNGYGHARSLMLERVKAQGDLPLFKVTGDDQKHIYEKTDKKIKPFVDGATVLFEGSHLPPHVRNTELQYGEGIRFEMVGALGPMTSDYKVLHAAVAYGEQIYDLITLPKPEAQQFRD